VAVDPTTPTTIYASTEKGLFKSTDGGLEWTVTALRSTHIEVLAIDPSRPSTIYAAISDRGVVRSTDGGAHWRDRSSGLVGRVESLALDPRSPRILYAGTSFHGIYKTLDGGKSWTLSGSGLDESDSIFSIAIDPVDEGTVYVSVSSLYGDDVGVFKTTDGGGRWQSASEGLPEWVWDAVAVNPVDPSRVYVGGYFGVFATDDGGGHWYPMDDGLQGVSVRCLAVAGDGSALHVGAQFQGVFDLELGS
jgi:photosystem II stability/assembly factor-like uncharacterized protein